MNNANCERNEDLISFLYGELEPPQSRDFQAHLHSCSVCREEASSMGEIREAIGLWKQEALAGFSPRLAERTESDNAPSALAALREFFRLSPGWLKGAVAFASLLFCLLAVLAVSRLATREPKLVAAGGVYTQKDLDDAVRKALSEQAVNKQNISEQQAAVTTATTDVIKTQRKPAVVKPSATVASRRPLTRAEREQLAADLRLTTAREESVQLLGDRINY